MQRLDIVDFTLTDTIDIMTTPVRLLLRVSRALTSAPCRAGPAAPARAIAYGRLYSTDSSKQGVQPPDFLGEGELKVFNILKNSLHPTKLEVREFQVYSRDPIA